MSAVRDTTATVIRGQDLGGKKVQDMSSLTDNMAPMGMSLVLIR